MSYKISILPSGRQCLAQAGDTVLEAGLRAGLSLKYGCSNGNCGKCKSRLISGQIKPIRHHDFTIAEHEKLCGAFLMCSNTPLTDIEVEAEAAQGPADIPLQDIEATIKAVKRIDDQIVQLHLRTPRAQRLRFLAGQSVVLSGKGLPRAAHAVASCPCDDRNLQFHIPCLPGDAFCDYAFSGKLRTGSAIRLQGPKKDDFFLQDDLDQPLMFICWHTGFAPVSSLIEHCLALETEQDIFIYRLSPTPDQQYHSNLCRSWADAFDNIHLRLMPERFTLVTGQEDAATIVRSIAARHDDLSDFAVYTAGPPSLNGAVQSVLAGHGVPPAEIRTHVVGLGFFD